MWHRYQNLTAALPQQLCEQLRLILEPTQAAKLWGDYRTGKRLNTRKVIPYIASQFRKDKIWLRRTKPSKREYQICLAVDDSSSMVDNHSKQLAFESLSVIINALTLLEVGQVSVCSFDEQMQLLHPFQQQSNDESGARILWLCQFKQNKTRIAQVFVIHVPTWVLLRLVSSPSTKSIHSTPRTSCRTHLVAPPGRSSPPPVFAHESPTPLLVPAATPLSPRTINLLLNHFCLSSSFRVTASGSASSHAT
ncbi:midasin-like [Oryzias melastigma]|uniref:midasin-like n=1 Tax=Oryzias melastigma TaxID=30732 RepID=UPI00168D7F59|nr:midasin-like [Oryzias melastigma]